MELFPVRMYGWLMCILLILVVGVPTVVSTSTTTKSITTPTVQYSATTSRSGTSTPPTTVINESDVTTSMEYRPTTLHTTIGPPNAPSPCSTSNLGTTSITVSWQSTPQATIFYMNVLNFAGLSVAYYTTNETTRIANNLIPGSAYTFVLVAGGAGGNSSNTSSCTISTVPETPVILPTNMSRVTYLMIPLAWYNGRTRVVNSTYVSSQDVTSSTTSPSTTSYLLNSETSFNITNLQPGRTYQLCVIIQSYDSNSTTNCTNVTTAPLINGTCQAPTVNTTSLTFSWPTATAMVSLFYIFDGINTTATQFVISQLTPGQRYNYTLKATASGGATSPTVYCVDSTDPDEPNITRISNVTDNAVTLSWSTGKTVVISSSDVCYRDNTNGSDSELFCTRNVSGLVAFNKTSYSVPFLSPGRTYQFTVTVYSFSRNATSDTVSQTTVPLPPSAVWMVGTASNVLQVSWTPSVNSTQSSFNVTYQRCNETTFRQITFTDNCTMTSCVVTVAADDRPGSSYIAKVYSVSNNQQSIDSTDAYAYTVPNKPSVKCNHTSSTGVTLTMGADGEVDFYSITTVCPWERILSQRCNTTVSSIYGVESIDGLNAYKVYTFSVIVVKNRTSASCANTNSSRTLSSLPVETKCTTSEKAPDTPRNFTSTHLRPWLVTLTWTTPLYPNGLINQFAINYTGTKTGSQPNEPIDSAAIVVNVNDSISQVSDVDAPDAIFAYNLTHLIAGYTYTVTIQAINGAGLGNPNTTTFTTRYEQSDPVDVVPIIVGVVVGVVLAALLIILIVLIVRRFPWRNGSKKDSGIGVLEKPYPNPGTQRTHKSISSSQQLSIMSGRPVQKSQFAEHVKHMAKDSNLEFSAEYEDLKFVGRGQSLDAAELPSNRTKNRYSNIKPYDKARVKLLPVEDEEGSDYINASWMPGFNSRREFIAAQGPLPSTQDDFWRMIWEYNCRCVVMLTRCVENGRNKCEHYWPTHTDTVVYGDLQGQQSRKLKHFFYQAWPDCDVPTETDTFVRFMRLVRNDLPVKSGPIVVHCSAGVGRTGTYIAIDTLIQQLEQSNDLDPMIDVYGVVYRQRMNRFSMVQTEAQYIFIHNVLKGLIGTDTVQPDFNFGEEHLYQNQSEIKNGSLLNSAAVVTEVGSNIHVKSP